MIENDRIFDICFIQELNKKYIPISEKNTSEKVKKYRSLNKEKWKGYQEKYLKSAKGKNTRSKRYFHLVLRKLETEEKEMILQFYRDCPKGYEVDHIIPLSKGGCHRMHNLQHLPNSIHRRKASRILVDLKLPPHCILIK